MACLMKFSCVLLVSTLMMVYVKATYDLVPISKVTGSYTEYDSDFGSEDFAPTITECNGAAGRAGATYANCCVDSKCRKFLDSAGNTIWVNSALIHVTKDGQSREVYLEKVGTDNYKVYKSW